MSLGKVARKLKRVGKTAVQFRFTSTFEYIDLSVKGSWRPDNLRIVWLRNHRKVKSQDVQWIPKEDRGPKGAEGRASFDPIISVALIVTLYREHGQVSFQEKEYKYYLENHGPNGKKILASFHCNMSDYAGIPTAEHSLDMNFNSVSVKVQQASLGITLKSEFIKQGSAVDDDMQSTFSAMSAGTDASHRDDDTDEEEEEMQRLSIVQEDVDAGAGRAKLEDSVKSVLVLGTGETLKRNHLPVQAPPKPSRSASVKSHNKIENSPDDVPTKSAKEPTKPAELDPLLTNEISQPPAISNENHTPPQPQSISNGNHTPPAPVSDVLISEPQANDVLESGEVPVVSVRKKAAIEEKKIDQENKIATATNGQQKESSPSPIKKELLVKEKIESVVTKKDTVVKDDRPTLTSEQSKPTIEGTCSNSSQDMKDKPTTQPDVKQNTREDTPVEQDNPKATNGNSLIESDEPKPKPQASQESGVSNGGGGFDDYVFEAARSLAQLRKSSEASKTDDAVPVRKGVQSQDEYRPPPNPYLDDSSEIEESMEPPSPTASWLGEKALFVDCFGEAVGREKLDRAEIIALYFSASWCPPCRRFLPKLVKFYHHVKQHAKSFEILYISSDYSRQDMMKYMQQQQMPWVGLSFEGKQSQDLQKFFKVMAIPQLRVVTTKGELIEESAKKPVEATSSGSDVLRLYNKWYEKVEPTEGTKEKGLFQKVKKAIKDRTGSSHDMADTGTSLSKSKEDLTGTRHVVVQNRAARGRSTLSTKNKTKEVLLEEKEERVRHLEEVNMALKQTNDDLNEEVADLKKQLAELQTRMDQTEQTSMQLEKDKRETVAKLSTRGWLCKRGVKGPTANVWRRRYFRCDQGSKVFYYKNASEGTPQGFIDLTKLISLQEVSPAQQDKNNATFLVQCDGRTYQLQALDEANMRKWMSAIEYLANWHRTNTLQNGATP